jgi:hypothetical protein
VTIEDEVFVGHGVLFINDRYPRATRDGRPQTEADWTVVPTLVRRGASIGSGAVILCGVTIGAGALVGAGAVVSESVAEARWWPESPRGCGPPPQAGADDRGRRHRFTATGGPTSSATSRRRRARR